MSTIICERWPRRAALKGPLPERASPWKEAEIMPANVRRLKPTAAARGEGHPGVDMLALGRAARAAARHVALATSKQKDKALISMAMAVEAAAPAVLTANEQDMTEAKSEGASAAFLDRLRLDDGRAKAMAEAIRDVAALPDPVGRVLATIERPNGLKIERVATPLGVVGVIFESRPNVIADASALCLKAGNASILRTGSGGFRTAQAIHAALVEGLSAAGLPREAISFVATRDR